VTTLGDEEKQDEITRAVITNNTKKSPESYVYKVTSFFEKHAIDVSRYESELESGLTACFTEETTEEEKEHGTHLIHLKLGMNPEERDKQIDYLLQHKFDKEIDQIGERWRTHMLSDIRSFIEEYNVSPQVYAPKVDALVNAAMEKGDINTARNYAGSFKHPFSEELKVLAKVLE